MLYAFQRRYAEAWPLHQRELAIWEKAVGLNRPDLTVAHLKSLAELYPANGRKCNLRTGSCEIENAQAGKRLLHLPSS